MEEIRQSVEVGRLKMMVAHIASGAGFLPSTVVLSLTLLWTEHLYTWHKIWPKNIWHISEMLPFLYIHVTWGWQQLETTFERILSTWHSFASNVTMSETETYVLYVTWHLHGILTAPESSLQAQYPRDMYVHDGTSFTELVRRCAWLWFIIWNNLVHTWNTSYVEQVRLGFDINLTLSK